MRLFPVIPAVLACFFTVQASVTAIHADFRKGKTYVTWTDDPDTTVTYRIYRSTSPITDVSSLTPVGRAVNNSAYDPRYGFYHIIVDSGAPLDTGTGLFVYTPKESASAYYAVTVVQGAVENRTLVGGDNNMGTPVAEERWQWPAGVLRSYEAPYSRFWMYYYWMDYDDWPHNYDYYGDLFQVVLIAYKVGQHNLPLGIFLHGYSGVPGWGQPSGYNDYGYSLDIKDNCVPSQDVQHTWWFGVSNNYRIHGFQEGDTIIDYTSMRLVYYTQAVKRDARFSIDTNRVYLSGQSMGGGGSLLIGCHYPDLFAAFNPLIGRMNYPESMFAEYWGPVSLGLTYRNGVQIYKWNNVGWILERMRGLEMSPVLDECGSKDGLHPFYTHSYFYGLMQKNHQGIWAKWLNIGHEGASYGTAVPGGYLRFRRDEMFPAFANASRGNGDYGTVPQSDSFFIAIQPAGYSCDSAGTLNCQVDWSSSLHRLNLPGDSLVDSPDSLRITFLSGLDSGAVNVDSVRVDITPRRLQQFSHPAGAGFHWTNYAVSGGLVDSGSVVADSLGLFTVPQFLVTGTGNRLLVVPDSNVSVAVRLPEKNVPGLTVSPNPFSGMARISFAGEMPARLTVTDIRGRTVYSREMSGETSLDARNLTTGVYLVRVRAGKTVFSSRILVTR